MSRALLAYDLADTQVPEILDGIARAPYHREKWGSALRGIVRAVHSIPKLFGGGVTLANIEVYIGRSYPEGVVHRFDAHRDGKKGHEFGMVVCTCPTDSVGDLERLGVRLLTLLKARGCLCVANAAADDRGRLPRSDRAVIYLTWRLVGDSGVAQPTRRDCDELVWKLGTYPDIPFSRQMIRAGVNDISRPRSAQRRVKWHRLHCEMKRRLPRSR